MAKNVRGGNFLQNPGDKKRRFPILWYTVDMDENSTLRYTPDPETGLTDTQVQNRINEGHTNRAPSHITKTAGQILKENICTLFNLLNFCIALCLLLVGSYRNLLFLGVVLSNLAIGVFQQLRSKQKLEKLSVLSQPGVQVVRNGRCCRIPVEELVLDDVIELSLGSQVPADAVVLCGSGELNEALLTGESDPIRKSPGDNILSGSFVVSGTFRARVEHVGSDNYAASLAQQAKRYQKTHSELMQALGRIVQFTGMLVVPLGLLLFIRSFFTLESGLVGSVEQAAASMIGMIPSGLMLLCSVSLALGAVTLARKQTLVQDLYCIETLSRVDTLCLDKTGTLTAGRMEVTEVVFSDPDRGAAHKGLLRSLAAALPKDNATALALGAYCAGFTGALLSPTAVLPFSSKRKYSAAAFSDAGVLYLGAPEFLCPVLPDTLTEAARAYLAQGCRVLVFAQDRQQTDPASPLEHPAALGLIILSDVLRPEAADTLAFFHREGVTVKLISGDNPQAVSSIAKRLELPGADAYIDVSALNDTDLAAAATRYTVFGRVSPEQKRVLIKALQTAGHTVAMTGDGVNDVLALKDADCSVAMAAGSDAARQVAQLVLLDNNFASLPHVVMEGRRVINNVTRTASLFLVKTMFSFLLTVASLLFGMVYPFQPIQLSLISALTIGVPAFLLAMEPNRTRVTGRFLLNVLSRALPGSLCVFLYMLLANSIGPLIGLDPNEVNTLCVYLTGIAGLCFLLRVCNPLNLRRGLLCAVMAAAFLLGAVLFRGLLQLMLPTGRMLYLLLPLGLFCYPLLGALTRLARWIIVWLWRKVIRRVRKKQPVSK